MIKAIGTGTISHNGQVYSEGETFEASMTEEANLVNYGVAEYVAIKEKKSSKNKTEVIEVVEEPIIDEPTEEEVEPELASIGVDEDPIEEPTEEVEEAPEVVEEPVNEQIEE
jgi:hypothetical protein